MGNKNIIELNGKRYDALTGAILKTPVAAKHSVKKVAQTLDGMVGKNQPPTIITPTRAAEPKPTAKHPVHKTPKARRPNTKPAHQPERAKTLMRTVVSKPKADKDAIHSVQAPSSSMPSRIVALPAAARASLNERRLVRSQQISKSRMINRFRRTDDTVSKRVEPIPVKKPAQPKAASTTPRPAHKAATSSTNQKSQDIFTIGLAKATSHQQKPVIQKKAKYGVHRRRHRALRATIIIAVIIIILAIAGFIFYRNLPGIELKVASARSGVHATMPDYKPPGFKATIPVNYAPGTTTINFRNASNKQFGLVQQNSDWDSQTLRDSFVSTADPTYHILQAQGRTIYVYGNGNATWVNGGIWYQINGSAGLSNSQIIDIATSL